jgi:PiT family inorganic phosphate transporter
MNLTAAFAFVCIFSAGLNLSMGANDESMASAYGSRALSLKWCLIVGGIAELAGSVLFGTEVATTIAGKLFSLSEFAPEENEKVMALVLSSLVGATVFMLVTSAMGLPVSSTHSIIGAVASGAVALKGFGVLNGSECGLIVASWFVSPVLSGLSVVTLSVLIDRLVLRHRGRGASYERARRVFPFCCFVSLVSVTLFVVLKGVPVKSIPVGLLVLIVLICGAATAAFVAVVFVPRLDRFVTRAAERLPADFSHVDEWKTERLFAFLQATTATLFAFARGSNDSSHGAGPFALAYLIYTNSNAPLATKSAHVDLWVLAAGGASMCLGLWMLGRRVVMSVGDDR